MSIKRLHNSARAVGRDYTLVILGGLLLVWTLVGADAFWLQPVRLALALVYLLFVPGHFLTMALFPRSEDLDGIERLGLGLGLSIAWVPVLALILDALPWGLRQWPLACGEALSIAVFAGVGLLRRARPPIGEAYVPALALRIPAHWRSLDPPDRRAYVFVGVALIVTAAALASTVSASLTDRLVTEFYALGAEGLAENYPRRATVGEEIGVTVGVANRESGPHSYRVDVWAVDPWTEGRRALVARDGPVELAAGDKREWPISWRMPWPAPDQTVELFLFDGDGAQPYRTLRLWLDVTD